MDDLAGSRRADVEKLEPPKFLKTHQTDRMPDFDWIMHPETGSLYLDCALDALMLLGRAFCIFQT